MHAPNSEKRTAQLSIAEMLDSDAPPGWPIIFRLLEKQASGFGCELLILGALEKMRSTTYDLASDTTRADLVLRLRTLTDILSHRPVISSR